jgi:hypothetical protein
VACSPCEGSDVGGVEPGTLHEQGREAVPGGGVLLGDLLGRGGERLVVDQAAADEPAGELLPADVGARAGHRAVAQVHDAVLALAAQVERAGLLRVAQQLEDVGQAERVERPLEPHLRSTSARRERRA